MPRIDRALPALGKILMVGLSAFRWQPKGSSWTRCPQCQVCIEAGNLSEPVTLDSHKSTGTWEEPIISNLMIGLTAAVQEPRRAEGDWVRRQYR